MVKRFSKKINFQDFSIDKLKKTFYNISVLKFNVLNKCTILKTNNGGYYNERFKRTLFSFTYSI